MNKSIYALYMQYDGNYVSGDDLCYLCGLPCTQQYTVAKGIADTFNSHYLAACPSSPCLCDACQWYFNDKSHPEFRKMSLIVTPGSWQNWQRDTMKSDIRRWLEQGLQEDSYLVVSLSKKKHILLQAPLNSASSRDLAIQVEENIAHVSLASWQAIEQPFVRLMALGHNKGEILSGELYGNTLHKHGQLLEALKLNGQLSEWRKSPIIELFSYGTIIDKEKESENNEIDGSGDGQSGDSTISTRDRTTTVPARAGDTPNSSGPAPVRMERHRQRVSEQVSSGNMEDVRGKSGDGNTNHEQLSLFPE